MNVRPIARRSVAAAAMATGLAVAGLSVASPASAAKATPSSVVVPYCTPGYACFYPFEYFGGHQGKVAGNNANFGTMAHTTSECHTGTWNDCIESIDNEGTQCTVYFFVNANYKGGYHSLGLWDQVGNFATDYGDASFNDAISSNSWCTPNP